MLDIQLAQSLFVQTQRSGWREKQSAQEWPWQVKTRPLRAGLEVCRVYSHLAGKSSLPPQSVPAEAEQAVLPS